MKQKYQDEIVRLLASEKFGFWLAAHEENDAALRVHTAEFEIQKAELEELEQHAEFEHRLADESMQKAVELEERAAELISEIAQVENRSFDRVAAFESQRTQCSLLWQECDKAEQENSTKLSALQAEYERENQRKHRLWQEVELLWAKSTDKKLGATELSVRAGLYRNRAETRFQRNAELAQRAELMSPARDELKHRVESTLREREAIFAFARKEFGAIVYEEFLYWPSREQSRMTYVCPLIDDAENYAVDLRRGELYACPQDKGVTGLRPLSIMQADDEIRVRYAAS